MRYLTPPVIDDRDLLNKVVNNPRLHAAPVIRPLEAAVAQRYVDYVQGRGNPWLVMPDTTFHPPRPSFHRVYLSPPADLGFITAIRKGARGACPMCGSDGTGTLDHYLPKVEYPEFSFFSLNLVPACFRCNLSKTANYAGTQADERPVHPYYDLHAGQRLMSVEVNPPFDVPSFRPIPWNPPVVVQDSVRWHIEKIVMPAGFTTHCQQRWSRLLDDPQRYLGKTATPNEISNRLQELASNAAHLAESPNSWDSCFFHGISQQPDAIAFLTQTLGRTIKAVAHLV